MPWPAIIGALASAGAGVAGWLGQRSANEANQRLAREQMAFQERMSNTSAQRSVADYASAGLNPALAYDRPASAPAGALSRVEDAIGKGVSSALQAKALQQSLENSRVQNEALKLQTQADLELKNSQTRRNAAEGATAVIQGDLLQANRLATLRGLEIRNIDQPAESRSKAARAAIDEFGIAAARNQSAMESRLGELSPQLRFWLNSAGMAARLFRPF